MSQNTHIELISRSPEETQELGRRLARHLGGGQVVALTGHLGAGKTQWVKGLAAGLGIDRDAVHSPTFTLINEYGPGEEMPNAKCQMPNEEYDQRATGMVSKSSTPGLVLYHVDVYRLAAGSAAAELEAIGFSEIVAAGDGVVAVEWADRVAELIPPDAVWIDGSMPSQLGPTERCYRIRAGDANLLEAINGPVG